MSWAILGVLVSVFGMESEAWVFDFQKDKPGREPEGFYFDETGRAPSGRWRIVEVEGNQVLGQLDTSRDRDRYALAVAKELSLEHLEVSVRIKAAAGDRDQAGGVMWRYRNSENYLVARLDVTEDNVRLYRFVRGNRIQFGVHDNLELTRGRWYTLRVEHRGQEIKVYLDDRVLFIEHDRHFTRPGKIGLWTKSDSVMHFDNLRVEKLDDRHKEH